MTMGSLESIAGASGFEDNMGLEHAQSNPQKATLIARSMTTHHDDASYDFVTARAKLAVMRVGELLLQRGWVSRESIARALADQKRTKLRLCSQLIANGVLEQDKAAQVLGDLHQCAAVMKRHLVGRDASLASLLTGDKARELAIVPIGRASTGALIVCVRDPSPVLQGKLAWILGEEPVLAVAPASALEQLLDAAYELDIPIEVDEPCAPKKRALSVVVPVMAPIAARDALDTTLAAFREIDDIEWLFDVATQYLAKAWSASLLVALREKRAVGARGHGARVTPAAVRTYVVDIEDSALIATARTERRILVDDLPLDFGDEQELITTMLGTESPIVAPIIGNDAVTHVLLLGEPIDKDRDDAVVDLGLLVDALGQALARM